MPPMPHHFEQPNEIPQSILDQHPELVAVDEALVQLERGEEIRATCPTCRVILSAEAVTGAVVISCPGRHTYYRARRS